ncbi:MAG: putative biosynthesis related glycosyltransferase [Deltaproteobacteria bacterium]|nr:putative biosynthesis related glycosyltransferase [Deltaproteobacteria bacterium]
MKPVIRLDFCDMGGVDKRNNFFTRVLSRKYNVEINDRPDVLVYSNTGHLHKLYSCKKVFWTSESLRPDFEVCDYAVTCFYIDDPRHLRLPCYVTGSGAAPADLLKTPGEVDAVARSERKFCSFIITNDNRRKAGRRIDFFHKLGRYKWVDSAGRALNNIGEALPLGTRIKRDFNAGYKFHLCFENRSLDGYTTEKLVDAMWARCIPIYWGNPLVGKEFNKRSFLHRNDYGSDEEFIEKIVEIDRDEGKYRAMLAEPYFPDDRPNEFYDEDRILDFFDRILSDGTPPVCRRRRFWHPGRWHLAKAMRS